MWAHMAGAQRPVGVIECFSPQVFMFAYIGTLVCMCVCVCIFASASVPWFILCVTFLFCVIFMLALANLAPKRASECFAFLWFLANAKRAEKIIRKKCEKYQNIQFILYDRWIYTVSVNPFMGEMGLNSEMIWKPNGVLLT